MKFGFSLCCFAASFNVVPDHPWKVVRSAAFQGMCRGILLGTSFDPDCTHDRITVFGVLFSDFQSTSLDVDVRVEFRIPVLVF